MDFTALHDGHQPLVTKQPMLGLKLLLGTRLFDLCMLALLLTWSRGSGVEAFKLTYNGFTADALYVVQNTESDWTYYANESSFYLKFDCCGDTVGRILYPEPVQMKDPVTNVVKSFSTTFIYQIYIPSGVVPTGVGSGMAFLMVPNNSTIGAPYDYMGLLTTDTASTQKDHLSDDHTFGVELDTLENPEFGDPNGNHFGIDLASVNSTYTLTPTYLFTTEDLNLFQQVWIDYFQVDSRIDLSYGKYGDGKPLTPQASWTPVNLSLLNEYTYIGFSASIHTLYSKNEHSVLAWSFSNEGEADPILIARDAGPPGPISPPPPTPSAPTPNVPVPAPNPPPNAQVPPSAPPAPIIVSPPPINASADPPSPAPPSNPSPLGAPGPPSPSAKAPPPQVSDPSPDPSVLPADPSRPRRKLSVGKIVGVIVGAIVGFFMLVTFLLCWNFSRRRPLHIFLSHTGGEDGSLKNFPIELCEALKSSWRLKYSFNVFIDRYMPKCESFPVVIKQELAKVDLGIVVVTEEYFGKKWPMIELVELVNRLQESGSARVRILPLFFTLKPAKVRELLEARTWEANWEQMASEKHPIDVQKYKEAVETLCLQNGVEYIYSDRSHQAEYIKEIVREVGKVFQNTFQTRYESNRNRIVA